MSQIKEILTKTTVSIVDSIISIFTYFESSVEDIVNFFIRDTIANINGVDFAEGELGYSLENTTLSANLNDQGELIVNDLSTAGYSIDINGDLIYTDTPVTPISLFDFMLPVYIQNTERNNMNPSPDTPWIITNHDTTAKTITVDRALPADIADYGTDWKKRWTLHGNPFNWVYISNVDFGTNTITYSYKKGTLSVGHRARFLNPFRSFSLDPPSYVIGSAWSSRYVDPAGVYKHSDGTYRMIVNALHTGLYGMSGIYASTDLLNWYDIGGFAYYRAGVYPFNESWCVGMFTHYSSGSPVPINGSPYYVKPFQGVNAAGKAEIGIVVIDEDYNIIHMPTSGISVPGYPIDATHIYVVGGMVYYNGEYLMTMEYRNTATGGYTILLITLDNPYTYNITNVEVVAPALTPNSFCQLTMVNTCPLVFEDNLYIFIGGENDLLTDSPLLGNHVGGVWSKIGGVWTANAMNPLFMNPIEMSEIYVGVGWATDHIGVSWSFILEGDNLYCFVAMKESGDYKIARTVMALNI